METRKLSEIIYPELLTTQKLELVPNLTNNFMLWRLKLTFVLKDHNVHNILETPNQEDPLWLNAERTAKNLICQRIDPILYHELEKSSTVKAFLDHLEKTQKVVKYGLCQKYSYLKMESEGDVNEHVFRMRAMAKLVGFSGVEVDEKVQGLMVLESLPEDWDEEVERVMMELQVSKEGLSFDSVGRSLRAANEFREWRKYRDSIRGGWSQGGSERGSKKGAKGENSTSNGDETVSFSYDYDPSSLTEIIYSGLKTRYQLNHTGRYFQYWKHLIHHVLLDNKVDYLLKDYSPSKEDASSQSKRSSDEFTARHLILGGMSDDLFLTFHDYPTARSLMDALDTWFNCPSIAHQMVMFNKYKRCQMSENATIDKHLLDMDTMICNLQVANIHIPDVMQAQRMINSLPRSWHDTQTILRTNLEFTNEDNKKLKLVDGVRQSIRSIGIRREMREDSERRH